MRLKPVFRYWVWTFVIYGWASTARSDDFLPQSFASGEELRYEIRWGVLKGGELTIDVEKGEGPPDLDDFSGAGITDLPSGEYWRFRGRALSSKWVSVFYRVDDGIEGWVDSVELLPRALKIRVDESGERGSRFVAYDHPRGVAHYRRRRDYHRKRGPQTLDRQDALQPGSHDALSALFFLRRHPLVAGQELTLPVHENGKNREALVSIGKPERIRALDGKIEAWPLQIRVSIEGKLASKRAMRLWISTDARRLPVRFEAELAWGSLKGVLLEHRGPGQRAQLKP